MTLLGLLLRNRRAGEAHSAWHQPHLRGPELLTLTSQDFADGAAMALRNCAKHIGGTDLSPHLAWTPPPPGTAQLLLVVEDIDIPLAKPAVHCLALIDPAAGQLEPGALSARHPGPGVRVLRSTVGRGYHGPGPIKGHGPHHYVFQLFALQNPLDGTPLKGNPSDGTPSDGAAPAAPPMDRARPRTLLATVPPPVLGRARLTGVFER